MEPALVECMEASGQLEVVLLLLRHAELRRDRRGEPADPIGVAALGGVARIERA